MAILKDIKNGIADNKKAAPVATAEFFGQIREQIAENPKVPPSANDITNMLVGMIGQAGAGAMDDKGMALFEQLAKHVFTQREE